MLFFWLCLELAFFVNINLNNVIGYQGTRECGFSGRVCWDADFLWERQDR